MNNTSLRAESDIVTETKNLKLEVRLLRSFMIGMLGKDDEGEYNPKFIKKALKAAEQKSIGVIKSADKFFGAIL